MKRLELKKTFSRGAAAVLALAAWLAWPASSLAQRTPTVGYVYPAGGRQGTSFQAVMAGQYLDGVNEVVVSGEGVRATVVEHVKPLNGRVINLLRDRLRELQKGISSAKRGDLTVNVRNSINTNLVEKLDRAAVEAEIADTRKKLANPKNRARENPQLSEDITLQFVLAPDAEPGQRELRLKTAAGLSNPLVFHVGQLPECFEAEPKTSKAPLEMAVSLPMVINGQIMPGDVDRYKFRARTGQKLVVAAYARALIPYLADAVPGWFQATLALFDGAGKEVAFSDDYRFDPDPVLFFEIPRDGEYVLEIRDSIYRGREDFVYRISMGELPFITSIFPLGAQVGSQAKVEVKGWNLPVTSLSPPTKVPGTCQISVSDENKISNRVPFAVDDLPELLEQEPNNSQGAAQPVKLASIINGRIEQAGDADVFCFVGKSGARIVAEVQARRLNSPLDSLLRLTDGSGKPIAINDDHEDRGAGLTTHHADSLINATLPADGTYYLHLTDAQQKGGAEYAYRLRISPPQPDFELRIVPSSINVRAGSTVAATVYALRKDGFAGDITLNLKDAPSGITLSGNRLPGNTNQTRLTIKVPPLPRKEPVSLSLEGRAVVQGKDIVRPAVPANDVMQAFLYRHLVPSQDLLVAVLGRSTVAAGKGGGKKTATAPPKKTNKTK